MIEIILVMTIVVILSIAAATGFNLAQRNLESVAKNLRSNLQLAQEFAMTYNQIYGFRAINTTSYEIYVGAPGTPATNPHTNANFIVNMSPVLFAPLPGNVPFQTTGQPTLAANATITLSDASATRNITVEQNTGFVTLGP